MHKNTHDLKNNILQYEDIPDRLKDVRDIVQKQIVKIGGKENE